MELKRDPRRTFRAIRKITNKGGYRKDLSMVCSALVCHRFHFLKQNMRLCKNQLLLATSGLAVAETSVLLSLEIC